MSNFANDNERIMLMAKQEAELTPPELVENCYAIQTFYTHAYDDEKIRAEIDVQAPDYEEQLGILAIVEMSKACQEDTRRRLVRTLDRLKQKGLYSADIFTLLHKSKVLARGNTTTNVKENGTWLPLSTFLSAALQWTITEALTKCQISDEAWFNAIETVVILYSPALMADENVHSYALFLDGKTNELWTYVALFHYVDQIRHGAKMFKESARAVRALEKENTDLRTKLNKQEAYISSNAAEIAEGKIKAERQKHAKAIQIMKHENAVLRKEKDTEIALLKAKIRELESGIIPNGAQAVDPHIIIPEDFSDNTAAVNPDDRQAGGPVSARNEERGAGQSGIELPDENVLFLGGHANLIWKVKALHPNWDYINMEEPRNAPPSTKIVIFWTNHISHNLHNKSFRTLPKDVDIIYVTATNIDRLEAEMREGYAKLLSASQEPA